MHKFSLIRRVESLLITSLLLTSGFQVVAAESVLETIYPRLQQLLLAHDVVQARAYEEMSITNDSPTAAIGQRVLLEELQELAESAGSHYHSAGDHSAMLGPHRVFESRATPGLLGEIREEHEVDDVSTALADNGNLPELAVDALQLGRQFVEQILEVYLDPRFEDKTAAVNQIVEEYLAAEMLSVASSPKSDELLSDHPYAYAYKVGFPQLSGLTWASHWLKIAVLEIVVSSNSAEERDRDIELAMDLYEEKLIRLHGSFVSLPSDIPTFPVVAPNFYSKHPEAAYIIDNLEILKVVIGDVLAHPKVEASDELVLEMLAAYTDKQNDIAPISDYLLYVLRGGIYSAGGPARGGMDAPDRNWSRERSENPHISVGRTTL